MPKAPIPYVVARDGVERLVLARSPVAALNHVMQPRAYDVHAAKASDVARLMSAGVKAEDAESPIEDPDDGVHIIAGLGAHAAT